MKQKYLPAPTVDHESEAPKSTSKLQRINDFDWGIPETEKIDDGTKIHLKVQSNGGVISNCMQKIRQLFKLDELDNLEVRLEGIYKQEPSEDILVQK